MPWPLVGNARAIQALERTLASDRARHAYLFAGPEHTGRATAAILVAQALNCTGEQAPCLQCDQCRRIAAGIHADVQTLTIEEAEDGPGRRDISVEQLREMERVISLAPYEGKARVIVIDPADAMNTSAQSAFLKSLEEPPPHVVFILVARETGSLLETVRSRCALVPFFLTPAREIEEELERRGANADLAGLLARLSAGRPGWAIRALADKRFLEERVESLDLAHRLPGMSLSERFALAESVAEAFRRNRHATLAGIDHWTSWWRDVLVIQMGSGESVANEDRLSDLEADARSFTAASVRAFVESLVSTRQYLAENVSPRIAMDSLMLDVPAPAAQSAHR